MKRALPILAIVALLPAGGCASLRQLPPLESADSVVIEIRSQNQTYEKIRREINLEEQVEAIVAFVNAQPPKWSVPWYGPPVGTVYFNFYRDGKFAGNFYIGSVFFGRDGSNFWSQTTTRAKIQELETIAGMPLWEHLHSTAEINSKEPVVISGRRSECAIRKRLLAQTPAGSDVRDVIAFINDRLKHEGGSFPSDGNRVHQRLIASSQKPEGRFAHRRIPDLTPRFSEKWHDETIEIRVVVSIHQGVPFRVWTTATWQFARDGSLQAVVVKKEIDGL